MLTRREKLLVRPWQLRRYNDHRRKVLAALPVIDFGPPPQREHVNLKLKKLQKEEERRVKIEEDNFRLLQRMGAIMRQNRLNDFWETKPPNFLRRVGVYHRTRTPSPCGEPSPISQTYSLNTRKSRCLACSARPQKSQTVLEERVPWEQPKSPSSRRNGKMTLYCCPSQSKNMTSSTQMYVTPNKGAKFKQKDTYLPLVDKSLRLKANNISSEKSIILEQGPLHLSINFPLYLDVKVKSKTEQIQRAHYICPK